MFDKTKSLIDKTKPLFDKTASLFGVFSQNVLNLLLKVR